MDDSSTPLTGIRRRDPTWGAKSCALNVLYWQLNSEERRRLSWPLRNLLQNANKTETLTAMDGGNAVNAWMQLTATSTKSLRAACEVGIQPT